MQKLSTTLRFSHYPFLKELGLSEVNHGVYRNGLWKASGAEYVAVNPSTHESIAKIIMGTDKDYEECMTAMESEKEKWMKTPGPIRGEIVRQIGDAFRQKKEPLGKLISLEMGKILSEGLGEV
jgi:aldehyde dehydrogenase family 7 protein A1